MARKKRKEKEAAARLPESAIAPPKINVSTATVYYGTCPTCGRRFPALRAIKDGAGHVIDHIGYFNAIDWDPGKPFGSAWDPTGDRSIGNIRPITPDQAPELLEGLKTRMIDGILEFIQKGWMGKDEVLSAINDESSQR